MGLLLLLTIQRAAAYTTTTEIFEYGTPITDQLPPATKYNFRDTTFHTVMHDQFRDAGRLYCYHSGQHQWVKKDRSYNWVFVSTYVPKPGDYLDRRDSDGDSSNGDDGHAMMIAGWDAASGVAITLDGPWNINFRPVDVDAEETSGTQRLLRRQDPRERLSDATPAR